MANNIIGKSKISISKMAEFVKSKNKNAINIEEIAKYFIEVGNKYNIRGDIAFCQSIIETGWFKFEGGTAVTPNQHNYCGLGVTSLGVKGLSFKTIKDGVTAQIQHLYAYASTSNLPTGETLLDPRFKYVIRGSAKTWEELSNKWAMNSNYGNQIISMYQQLENFASKEDRKEDDKMAKQIYIALSDGHGMSTAGKRTPILPNGEKSETGNFMHENEFNRAVVKYLDAELKRHGFKTLLVAPTDYDTPLEERTKKANAEKVDLYVSVHANANAGKWFNGGGIETFTWGSGESLKVGKLIHAELIKGSPLRDRGLKNGQHLWEIRATNAPAVLVECGFMDSLQDYKYLLSDSYRKECAIEIATGICKYYGITYKPQTISKEIVKETVKETISEGIKKGDGNMKLELANAQWKQLITVLEGAVKSGILTSDTWVTKAKNKALTVSEAVYLSLVLDSRRADKCNVCNCKCNCK